MKGMVVAHIITMMIRFRFLICIRCKPENPVYPVPNLHKANFFHEYNQTSY